MISDSKGAPELITPMIYENDNSEMLAKVSAQLMNALATIENMQESESDGWFHGVPLAFPNSTRKLLGTPIKIAEKRRNKFEFIRFGRK
ncbi:hypothetical protein Y032_0354g3306 [Ancylostoma ceylanicum]|uniref:Uncharacterized protein n=1 Tax=Ancylostoma ceylanicum TaxID=53326 RepID=A0A016RWF1_9BILA|nr:hypothetical protein Y032_0354g3306 [Ancylostoma ceylanicum]